MTNARWIAGAVAATLLAGATPALAQQSGVTFNPSAGNTSTYPGNLGYSFTVKSSDTVIGLGVWDQGGDGLTSSHQVGLWNSDGSTLLASLTVQSGTAGMLQDGFRYGLLTTPYALTVGQTYIVGATSMQGGDAYEVGAPVTAAYTLTFNGAEFNSNGAFSAPTSLSANNPGYFGGNVLLASSAAPEPAAWTLMIVGFGAAGTVLRRRKRPVHDGVEALAAA